MKSSILPASKGTYILIISLPRAKSIEVGKLGRINFSKGFYSYTGSALGKGGLAGRIKHHLNISYKPHWHIDYLRLHSSIKEIWLFKSNLRLEHKSTKIFMKIPGCSPIKNFGCSDCSCKSHLFYLPQLPSFVKYTNLFNINYPDYALENNWSRIF